MKMSLILHVNEVSFSYERIDTKTRFAKELRLKVIRTLSKMSAEGQSSRNKPWKSTTVMPIANIS